MFNKKKIIIILLGVLIPILFGYFYASFSFINGEKIAYAYTPIKEESIDSLKQNVSTCSLTKKDARKIINNIVDPPFYFYNETKLENKKGTCLPILHIVLISKDLSIDDYVITLTHELVHLKYNTADERFTTFETFKILYESTEFNGVACNLGTEILNGNISYEENCSAQIQEYLNK